MSSKHDSVLGRITESSSDPPACFFISNAELSMIKKTLSVAWTVGSDCYHLQQARKSFPEPE